MFTADGAIQVAAEDTITALNVLLLTDAAGRDVTLRNARGDVLVDRIAVGYQSGRILIRAPGDIREFDNADLLHDLTGDRGVLIADGEIGSRRNPGLNLEMDFRRGADQVKLVAGDYTIAEGQALTLSAAGFGASAQQLSWTINGHANAANGGPNPSLSWAELQSLGGDRRGRLHDQPSCELCTRDRQRHFCCARVARPELGADRDLQH